MVKPLPGDVADELIVDAVRQLYAVGADVLQINAGDEGVVIRACVVGENEARDVRLPSGVYLVVRIG